MKLQTGRYSLLLVALALLGGGGLALRSLPQPEVSQASPSLVPELSSPKKPLQLAQSDAQVSEQVYRLVNPAVVTVYAGPEVGSGSFVRSGWVITNRHVVREASRVTVKTADQTVYEGEVKAIDIRNDLALIHLTTTTQFPTVRLAESVTLQSGDRVFAIGSPFGKAGTLTRGTFSRITERGSLQTSSGLLKPGNSGGPLLNDRGEMIGVNKGLLEDNSGLATSVLSVRKFLDREFSERESLERVWSQTGQQLFPESCDRRTLGEHWVAPGLKPPDCLPLPAFVRSQVHSSTSHGLLPAVSELSYVIFIRLDRIMLTSSRYDQD